MILQFVDSIGASPTVRLDLADGVIWGGKSVGSTFSPPALRYAAADTILADGAYISASSYDNRVLHLVLDLVSSSADAKATALRALNTELNRAHNILKYQPGTTPLFFRTFRTSGYQLDESPRDNFTTVTVDIEAEPFAYGLRVTQAGVSVKANPALTNGCYIDVNGVTGDVETPAYVVLSAGSVIPTASASYMAIRRHGVPASLPFAWQAEAATVLGTDTIVTASNDVTASGAGNNTTTTSFATATAMTRRLTLPFALTQQVETRGTYRVIARVQKTVGTDTITMGISGSANTPATLAAGTAWQFVDLGLDQYPLGEDSDTGYSGTQPPLASTQILAISAARSSGSGSLKTDYVLTLPADENMCIFTASRTWDGTTTAVLDGPNDTSYVLDAAGGLQTQAGNIRTGSIPLLSVGNNRIYLVENTTTAAIGDSSTVTVSYWPRFLTV